ncbi:hypothetical protein PAXRUDRAFT_189251 [Paxillus rubicundulus Ve08.2h10]|uniref:Uncharacterized protein n=1 Tax=Paxillus rubicundulus Ve08.2h10 TaxID=930991 RepID=A0A0D0DYV3_9AGAM|nr:hypothetical protein PAXRUDRAFT_189251 [Paxillus rubicundulus Ve08.2h10]
MARSESRSTSHDSPPPFPVVTSSRRQLVHLEWRRFSMPHPRACLACGADITTAYYYYSTLCFPFRDALNLNSPTTPPAPSWFRLVPAHANTFIHHTHTVELSPRTRVICPPFASAAASALTFFFREGNTLSR